VRDVNAAAARDDAACARLAPRRDVFDREVTLAQAELERLFPAIVVESRREFPQRVRAVRALHLMHGHRRRRHVQFPLHTDTLAPTRPGTHTSGARAFTLSNFNSSPATSP
jgi:hypothetical protein